MSETKQKDSMHLTVLVYGAAGSGKSILASTFPKPLILDADNSHKIYEAAKLFPDATYVRGDSLLAALNKAIIQIKEGTNKFETLVIDSLTALENKAVSYYKGLTSKNWDTSLYTNQGKKLNYDEWGSISGSTIALLTELRQYPINIVIVTQLSTTYDDGGEKYYPELIGKGKNESLHFADAVIYMQKVEDTSGIVRLAHMNSTANDKFIAKARTAGGYIDPIKNPNYELVRNAMVNTKPNLEFGTSNKA